jgi:hypothetical protein
MQLRAGTSRPVTESLHRPAGNHAVHRSVSREQFMMIHPEISAALARERVSTFMGGAQAAHQARLARAARSPAHGKRAVRRDGPEVLMRPVRSDDAPLLAEFDQTSQPVSQPC